MGNQWQRCKKRAKKHGILVIWKFGKIQYIRVQSDPPKKRMKNTMVHKSHECAHCTGKMNHPMTEIDKHE